MAESRNPDPDPVEEEATSLPADSRERPRVMRKPKPRAPKEKVMSWTTQRSPVSFAEALADAMAGNMATKRFELGDQIRGHVTRVSGDDVFVDTVARTKGPSVEVPDIAVVMVEAYVVDFIKGRRG